MRGLGAGCAGKVDGMEVVSRERVHIRSRESGVTVAAWRIDLLLDDGRRGAIVFADPHYRGEGALLGTPAEKLAELWAEAISPHEDEPDLPQLG
jgi:hypothetical protein